MTDEIAQFRLVQGLQAYTEGSRRCLSCSTQFKSWGAGNRICDPCKLNNEADDVHSYRFDDTMVDFQYDLTVAQIIKTVANTGNYVDSYDKKGFYKNEAQKDYRKKT